MLGLTIKLEGLEKAVDTFKDAPEKFNKAVNRSIAKIAYSLQRSSKQHTPVKTGRLINSIGVALFPSALKGEVQAGLIPLVNYAVYVHEGTKFMRPRPFLHEGLKDIEADIDRIVENEISEQAKTL